MRSVHSPPWSPADGAWEGIRCSMLGVFMAASMRWPMGFGDRTRARAPMFLLLLPIAGVATRSSPPQEVNTLDNAGGERKLADHDLVLDEMEKVGSCISYRNSPTNTQGALEINISDLGGGECNVADHALMLHENHKV